MFMLEQNKSARIKKQGARQNKACKNLGLT